MVKKSPIKSVLCVFLLITALTRAVFPCSLIEGYFYQVTRLRGTVVGVEDHDFRHPIRWMRQQVVLGSVVLSLYTYKSPRGTQPLKFTKTSQDGSFDFGALPNGHYTLYIQAPWGADRYDVQIAQLADPTESVLIDVSPIYPDCKGGHEFIANTKH